MSSSVSAFGSRRTPPVLRMACHTHASSTRDSGTARSSTPRTCSSTGRKAWGLSEYCATDLKRQYGEDYEALSSFVADGTVPTAENFTSVSLEPGELVVSFDPYQVGPYAAGPREVHIPASEVQWMLAVTLSPDAFSLVLGSGD